MPRVRRTAENIAEVVHTAVANPLIKAIAFTTGTGVALRAADVAEAQKTFDRRLDSIAKANDILHAQSGNAALLSDIVDEERHGVDLAEIAEQGRHINHTIEQLAATARWLCVLAAKPKLESASAKMSPARSRLTGIRR